MSASHKTAKTLAVQPTPLSNEFPTRQALLVREVRTKRLKVLTKGLVLSISLSLASSVCKPQGASASAQQSKLPERPQLVLKTGHSSSLAAIAFSPDGSLVATAGNDNRILIWETATGKLQWVLYGHKAPIAALSFGPLDGLLASGDDEGNLFLWNVVTGRKTRTVVSSEHARITALSVSPDGLWLAIGNARKLRLYNLRRGGSLRDLRLPICKNFIPLLKRMPPGAEPPPCDVEEIAFSKDSKLLGSAHMLGTVNVFDVQSGTNLISRSVPAGVYSSGTISSSGAAIVFDGNRHLLSAGNHLNSLSVWDVTEGKEIFAVRGYGVEAAAFSADGTQLAVSDTPILEHIRMWSIPSFSELEPVKNEQPLRLPLAAGNDNKLLVAAGGEGLLLMHIDSKSSQSTQAGPISSVSLATFSLDSKSLATAGADATLRIWDLVRGQLAGSFRTEWMTHAAFSGDGHWAAYFNPDEKLTLYEFTTGSETVTKFSHVSIISPRVAISPNGRWVAWNAPQLRLWHAGTAVKPIVLCPQTGVFSFSSDGKNIAAVCVDANGKTKHIRVWDVASASEIQSIPLESESAESIVVTTYSLGIAVPDKVLVWDLQTRAMKPPVRAKAHEIFTSFTFSGPRDRFVVTGGSDPALNNVKVWDASNGTVIRSLRGHTSAVETVATSNDGNWIASGGDDGTARIWESATGSEVCVLVSLASLEDTPDEWIILTKRGFFDGSADALGWVGWLEPDSTKLFPLDTFFESFYSPGLLSDVFARAVPNRNFDISDKLRIPAIRSLFEQRFITLQRRKDKVFLCMPETPNTDILQGIELKRDDTNVSLVPKDFIRNDYSAECAYERELPYSFEDLELAARSSSVHRPAVTRWDSVKAQRTVHSKLFIQAVGINKYPEDSGFGTLTYAKDDATAIADYFEQHASVIYDHVIKRPTLYDDEANRAGIRRALGELAEQAKEDDVVILFFSGHGAVPQGQEMFYFIPSDVAVKNPDQERDTGLSVAMIAEALRTLPARRVVVIIDACQAGGALDSLASVAEVKLAIEDRLARFSPDSSRDEKPSGVYILAAATPFREAVGYEQFGHGLLTEAILEVLGGSDTEGGTVSGPLISAKELEKRLPIAMKRVGAVASYKQTPVVFSLGADIPLSVSPDSNSTNGQSGPVP